MRRAAETQEPPGAALRPTLPCTNGAQCQGGGRRLEGRSLRPAPRQTRLAEQGSERARREQGQRGGPQRGHRERGKGHGPSCPPCGLRALAAQLAMTTGPGRGHPRPLMRMAGHHSPWKTRPPFPLHRGRGLARHATPTPHQPATDGCVCGALHNLQPWGVAVCQTPGWEPDQPLPTGQPLPEGTAKASPECWPPNASFTAMWANT